MKTPTLIASSLLFLTSAVASAAGLVNPDFEDFDKDGKPLGWKLPKNYRAERGAGSNGSAGLVYDHNDDTVAYASQRVELNAGDAYRFGAYVKAEDVTGGGTATMCLTWHDAKGKWLGEQRTDAVTSSTDGKWIRLACHTKHLPKGVAFGSLMVCVEAKLHGRFYYDKVFFEQVPSIPVAALYTSAYMNEAWEGDVSFAAPLMPSAFGAPLEKLSLRFEVAKADGAKRTYAGQFLGDDGAKVTIPVADFAFGTNTVTCILTDGAKTIGSAKTAFVRTKGPTRKIYIDRFGRTIVDGKPFLPFGMYCGKELFESKELDRFVQAHFNALMPYQWPTRAQLDCMREHGVYCIYDLATSVTRTPDAGKAWITGHVREFRNHPAILAWYLFDEQPSALAAPLRERYQLVKSLDPERPTWCANDLFDEARDFIGTIDAFGGDPYPIAAQTAAEVTKAMDTEKERLMGMRPIWEVIQFFGWRWIDPKRWPNGRRPTEAEMRNMTWQAFAGGARGIIYYAYHYLATAPNGILDGERTDDIWEGVKRIGAEVKGHERVLLFADTAEIKGLPKGVVGRTYREGNEEWKLLVNILPTEEKTLGLAPLAVKMERVGK